tara:strand:- start:11586 stop:11906 length:321 start_codon:yes stop_codon:yes gene_type:complete
MILLHIITPDQQQVWDISDYLSKEKLILNPIIIEQAQSRRIEDDGNTITSTIQYLLIGKTKGLLFNEIDLRLREQYPKNMPVFYSLPITHMDWEQADELISKTVKI